MNRQQRRAAKRATPKKQPSYAKLTPLERKEQLFKNGITDKDLKKSFEDGYRAGFTENADSIVRTIYAAICLGLNDEFHFGTERCMRVLRRIDHHVMMTLTSQDAIDEVYRRMKLEINFKEPFDRIEEVENEA